MSLQRKQIIASALTKHLSLSPVVKWISSAETFPIDSRACFDTLNGLNEDLGLKSAPLSNGLPHSEANVVVFSVIHSLWLAFHI